MDQRINIVTLGVHDFKRADNFYSVGLGWKKLPFSNDHVTFIDCGVILALYDFKALAEDACVSSESMGFHKFTLAQNVASKEKVDQTLKEAEKAGGKIIKPGQNVFWGGYSGYFIDLDEHLWEIAWNPHFTLDSAGRIVVNN
ncbi:MAG: VOC family protein [Alphaproteobacteria bacterium]|nr:VOC family protein [Alphaproteobacteria bacterium]